MLNPKLRDQMYFGPGIYSDIRQELWHGDIWHKSPLFGTSCIQVNNGKYIKYISIMNIIIF